MLLEKGYLRYKPATKAGMLRLTWQTFQCLNRSLGTCSEDSGLAGSGCSSNLSRKVYFFLFNALAHFNTHEADQLGTF